MERSHPAREAHDAAPDLGPPVHEVTGPDRYRAMRRMLLAVVAVDLVLAGAKGGYGLATGSLGLSADGLHSLLHALGSAVGLVGIGLAARPPDRSHPYGYERYEPLAALAIVGFMLLAIREILVQAWDRLGSGTAPQVTPLSFLIVALSAVASFGLSAWERRRGRELHSEVLATDGQRTLSDVLVSLTVAVGLLGSLLGTPFVDLLVSLTIAGLIGRAGWTRLRELSAILTDAAVVDLEPIANAAKTVEGVRDVHRVRARGAAGAVRVDLHVSVDPAMPAVEAHELTHQVVRRVQEQVGGIVEVLVHVGVHPEPEHGPGDHPFLP